MSGTVTVACKLPHGLELRLFNMIDQTEAAPSGTFRKVKRAEPIPGSVIIKGYLDRYDWRKTPAPPAIGGSFALTRGVDADFFAKWLAQNKDLAAVENGLIYAHEEEASVGDFVKEHAGITNGLEPMDPSNLPREFRGQIKTYSKDA
jgi:hypothetical protein